MGNKVQKGLDRMSELAVLAQDETKTDSDRQLYDKEFQTLDDYITDIATKDFNGVSLFDGTTRGITIDSDAKTFSMTGVNMGGANYTGIRSTAVATTTGAAAALTAVKTAITQLSSDRATVGSNISRLQHTG